MLAIVLLLPGIVCCWGFGMVSAIHVSQDGTQVYFAADSAVDDQHELFVVNVAGGPLLQLSGAMQPSSAGLSPPNDFAISPDQSTVVYRADQDNPGQPALYAVPTTGPPDTPLTPMLMPTAGVVEFLIAPDSGTVVYVANEDAPDREEIYRGKW